MENRGITTTILIIVLFIVGYWFFKTPRGAIVRNNIAATSMMASVYPATTTPAAVYTDQYVAYNGPKAYITYPIAKSSSSSSYSTSAPSYSSSTSYYVPAPNPGVYPSNGGCYVGGCSNQLCSDQPGAVSTCEYRAQYACYQATSRCERQASGVCGWTQTPGLVSCLNNSY